MVRAIDGRRACGKWIGIWILLIGLLWRMEPLAWAIPPASQPWMHVPGTCSVLLDGAVFAVGGSECGGPGTTFDTHQVYAPAILRDIASEAAPCPGITSGEVCYRMWYVGDVITEVTRIGYAISADGMTWRRVAGDNPDGSVLGPGPAGHFDSVGPAYMVVIKDGALFKMWYAGYASNLVAGIGYATSVNGRDWTRVAGPLAGSAVLRASGVAGRFDQDEVNTPFVLKDIAHAAAPCAGIATGDTCYRMWYEGVNLTGGFTFRIGYATSPDGMNWTRVLGGDPTGAVLGRGVLRAFDDASVGVPRVMKEGPLYRMWYEAKDFGNGRFTIGSAVSVDGRSWIRPDPSQPVWTGGDDPSTFTPDNVWAANVSKEGATYRMHYSMSTQPYAQRIGAAQMTPGDGPFVVAGECQTASYTLQFTTTHTISAGGFVLVTFPAQINTDQISITSQAGFAATDRFQVEQAAVSDADAQGMPRSALVLHSSQVTPAGAKTLRFTLAESLESTPSVHGWPVVIQIFDPQQVLEYGVFDLGLLNPARRSKITYLPIIRTQ